MLDTSTSTENLIKKVQMLIEQNELLRKHNIFLLEENTSIEHEFVAYKRASSAAAQELEDQLEVSYKTEQQRTLQLEQQKLALIAQLKALERGIDELYQNRS